MTFKNQTYETEILKEACHREKNSVYERKNFLAMKSQNMPKKRGILSTLNLSSKNIAPHCCTHVNIN